MLNVTVYQVGRGSATLVELPCEDGSCRVGLIDTFQGEDGEHPLLQDLDRLERNYPTFEISFLVLTHLHADHCWGIGDILRRHGHRVRTLCDPGIDPRAVVAAQYHRASPRDASVAADLKVLREFKRTHSPILRPLTSPGLPIYEDSERGVAVRSVAPLGLMLSDMQDRLEKYLQRRRTLAGEDRVHRPPGSSWYDLNRTSSAVEVLYEDNRIVVGGDVLAHAWRTLLESKEMPANVFVLSHHGARSGFAKSIWCKKFAVPRCHAVVSGRGVNQPDFDVVRAVHAHGSELWLTNRLTMQADGSTRRVLSVHLRSAVPREKSGPVVIRVGSGCMLEGLKCGRFAEPTTARRKELAERGFARSAVQP